MYGRVATNQIARRPAVTRLLILWCKRARVRRELAELSSRLARDVGITIDELERERRLPFWRSGKIAR